MKEQEKKLTTSFHSAQERESIDAVKEAEHSNPQTGDDTGFAAESTRDKEAEFQALIENEYKKEFSEKVQKIISKRLKEVKKLKEERDKNTALVESLLKRFNIEDGDTEKLERMIGEKMKVNENNNERRNEEIVRRLVEENRFLKKRHNDELRMMKMREYSKKLREQAEETKKAYPGFDFEKEMENPEFIRLLKIGVSVKNAYEVVNIDSILADNLKTVEKKVVDSIRSKGNRPVENGSAGTSGILLAGNVSKLSKKERAELAKRAAKGEKISF